MLLALLRPRLATAFFRCLLALTACGGLPPLLASEPYIPGDESVVLATLPTEVFARRDGIAKLRERLSADPDNDELAATVAQHYVGLGKSEGDPRFFGYARAAILPWWEEETASPAILKVRAKLKETDHAYRKALDDLRELLDQKPDDVQAWVEVANINRVLGEYEDAWQACDRLAELTEGTPVAVARVPLLVATGKSEEAYGLLNTMLPDAQENLPGIVPWVHTMLAETARARGQDQRAEKHYREGIEIAPDNSYLIRAYADFLLDQQRGEEALGLLGEQLNDNGILLRAAIAAKQTGRDDQAKRWSEKLHDRFTETRLRGDLPHGRYEARYEVEFGSDAQRALELALANWERQKESRDSRNVLEAALAAHDAVAAEPVFNFLKKHRTQDAALDKLIQQLEDE